jgi:two-component system, OmpR family, sensor histidine kinase MprB
MSLRRRMVLFTAAAVALAVVLSAVACYLAVQSSMRARIDHQLQTQASLIAASSARGYPIRRPHPAPGPGPFPVHLPQPGLQSEGDLAVLSKSGALYQRPGDRTRFTVTAHDLAVARGRAKAYFRDGKVGNTPVRLYVAPAGKGRAVIAIQSLADLDNTLHDLAEILIAIAIAGIAIAGLLGLFVARAAAAPVHLLRQAAEHVRSTGDLSSRISVAGADDLGRLGQSFNDMLGALEDSQRAQRQLIADASHELRTPVATIRTNLEVLARNPDLPAEDRAPLLDDLIGESAELGTLVEDLLESARDSDSDVAEPFAAISLDTLVIAELERWGRRHPGAVLVPSLEPATIRGRERRLRRALANLLDNAIKWSPPDAPIEVTVTTSATLIVRDHGPGFTAQDLPHIFDRFYRAPTARTIPGSGLGLSIVQKVAEEHDASVQAENAPGGGAIVTLLFSPLVAELFEPTLAEVGLQ